MRLVRWFGLLLVTLSLLARPASASLVRHDGLVLKGSTLLTGVGRSKLTLLDDGGGNAAGTVVLGTAGVVLGVGGIVLGTVVLGAWAYDFLGPRAYGLGIVGAVLLVGGVVVLVAGARLFGLGVEEGRTEPAAMATPLLRPVAERAPLETPRPFFALPLVATTF